MKNVVIFYASYGGGHLSAAKSIQEYIDLNYPEYKTHLIDCVESISRPINSVTTSIYKWICKNFPKLWAKVYNNSNKGFLGKFSTSTNHYLAKRLLKILQKTNPELVISVHPFSSQMTSFLKEKGKINCKLATVLTDFEPHDQWLIGKEFTDYFFVAHKQMKYDLIDKNIDESKVFDLGIPVSIRFFKTYDKNEICKKLNLNPNKKTILFFGGGEFGLGKDRTLKVLKTLIDNINRYQIVAISGRNEKMKKKFEELISPENKDSVKIFEFTNHVPELMSISSFVVTKPGGLTSSESLTSLLPMIIINPLPGHEEANATYLESSGCAVWIKNVEDIEETISNIINSPNKLEEMKNCAKKIAKSNPTGEICDFLLKNL